jgi:ATP-dependent Clp protease adaptor protein ClpS
MTLPSIASLLLVVVLISVLGWFIRFAWRSSGTMSVQRTRQTAQTPVEPAHIQAILDQGGPQSLREYLLVFPEACPQCGARTRYEGLAHTAAATGQVPLTPLLDRIERVWLCSRCGFGTEPALLDHPTRIERRIISPYLAPEQTETIPEPPYQVVGSEIQHVFALNDSITPMAFVEQILEQVFDRPAMLARHLMLDAHYQGERFVIALPQELAEERIATAHRIAQDAGYPLQFVARPSIESPSREEEPDIQPS